MCRADIEDAFEVYLHYRLSLSPLHSRKFRSRLLKELIFRENQSCIDRSSHRQKGNNIWMFSYYLINSIITSAFCRHKNSVIQKLTNFNSTLLTTSDSELNPLPVHSLFKEALKWTKPKLPLFNQVYALNIKQIWTNNQTEVIYPLLIFFVKNQPDHQNVLYFHSSLHFELITFFIPAIKALIRILAGLNRS